jgi:hypothetical protein
VQVVLMLTSPTAMTPPEDGYQSVACVAWADKQIQKVRQ